MKILDMRFVLPGSLLLLTLVSGYWLSHSGKPLNVAIFTLHKLIALSAVIAMGVTVYQSRGVVDFSALLWSGIAAGVALCLALFVTGALLSTGRPAHAAILAIHRAAPYMAALAAAAIAYLLAGRGSV